MDKYPEFELFVKQFNAGFSSPVIFIGGSTMAGKGIKNETYPEIFSNLSGISVLVYTKYLIKLLDVINIIENENFHNTLVIINCGGGDQQRRLNPLVSNFLPKHWSLPGHMEAPNFFSSRASKRMRQSIALLVKLIIKNFLRFCNLYPNTTTVSEYSNSLEKLISIAHIRKLKIYWIESALGNRMTPKFVRQEKHVYCVNILNSKLPNLPSGSRFVSINGVIKEEDLLVDGYHLTDSGHLKMGLILNKIVKGN